MFSMTTDKIVVKTPLGTITAQVAADTEHPGISFDLVRPGSEGMMSLGLVEFTSDGTEGGGQIITRVWGDGRQEDYTERIVHEGIEDFFEPKKEISTGKSEEYIVLCYPTQALGMIVDLGSGPTTENGDRSSQYFVIAKGRQHIDRTVTVALIENIHGLPEGEGYYTLHLVDNVSEESCELYHTDDLSEDALVNLLKEILDNLERGNK